MSKVVNKFSYTGYHHCRGDIASFKVRIRICQKCSDNMTSNKDDVWHNKEFCWQEKCFCKYGKDLFSQSSDTEQEIKESTDLSTKPDDTNFLFTYIDEDEYVSENEASGGMAKLQKLMEKIQLDTNSVKMNEEYDYKSSIISCFNNCVSNQNQEKMYIMADFGELVDDIWIKDEYVLCQMKYDKHYKVLSVFPDFSTTEPYIVRTEGESVKIYQYYIEKCTSEITSDIQKDDELMKIIDDCKMNILRNLVGNSFHMPPKNMLNVYLFFEITNGKRFGNNDIFVQYTLDLPEHWVCENPDSLTGSTQTCHVIGDDGLIHFGYNFEIILQYNLVNLDGNDAPISRNPIIYLEVISRGTWDRYRTEGLTFIDIPVSHPGCYNFDKSCFRFTNSGFLGELRRSLIGDYSNFKTVKWIGPVTQEEMKLQNKYGVHTIGTGDLNIRLHIINQSQAFLHEYQEGELKGKLIYDKLKSSSLIRSVNQVLLAFREARKNLIEVREKV